MYVHHKRKDVPEMHGFYRVAACVPKMKVADVPFNTAEIARLAIEADSQSAAIAVFPELSITAYTCGDLFHQKLLVDSALEHSVGLVNSLANAKIIAAFGLPVLFRDRLYNCAMVAQSGNVLGIVPKTFLPNKREFYEKRYFTSGADAPEGFISTPLGDVPFGTGLIFNAGNRIRIGVEICEDLWSVLPPSQFQAAAGANVLINLSASNALVSKAAYRRDLVRQQSARCMAAYIYSSAGVHESSTDTLYGGHAIIAENGVILEENSRFQRESEIIYADIDIDRLSGARLSEGSFADCDTADQFTEIDSAAPNETSDLRRKFAPTPFVPGNELERDERCAEIFSIQSGALAKRLEHSDAKKAVIGISGGLDSTLALLVAAETFKLLKLDPKGIIAVTMPGFGTSSRTLKNSVAISKEIGAELRKIDIQKACMRHFADISHDPAVFDTTYENVQARERTQVLMDMANKERGLVIGTGDLSEIALGWSTYNGDHMSMYAVNSSVPKTLVKHLVKWVADHSKSKLKSLLLDIIDTPVSPELLPKSADGKINHRTEDILGSYELHDFYLYHAVKYGAPPEKIRFLAEHVFKGKYADKEIDRTLELFFRRFFSQQFKRSCMPDGPKVGTISMSPRADWRMPSDASPTIWLADLD